MKKILLIAITLAISGCVTTSGNYTITGYDANGKELMGNLKLTAQGRGIYSARNAFCQAHLNATVIIKDSKTGEELKSESPYQCPNVTSKNIEPDSSSASDISSVKSPQLTSPSNNLSVISEKINQSSRSTSDGREAIEDDLESSSNDSSKSRLRLFGQNGAKVVLYRNSSCIKSSLDKEDETVSGGLSSAFSSFIGTVSNTSIGIPETDTTRHLNKKDGLLSKAYFREYEISANQPITLVMGFQDVSSFYNANGVTYSKTSPSCKGAIQFVPYAGADYEAAFSWSERGCELGINRVSQEDSVTTLKPVKASLAFACGKN